MNLIFAEWPAPANIRALTTTRDGGVSEAPFDSLNLGLHVNDLPEHVLENRLLLQQHLALAHEPVWLNQTHSARCIDVDHDGSRDGDAAVTRDAQKTLAILTADCLPVVFCTIDGSVLGAAHAGWRGLAGGVLENTVAMMKAPATEILAWIGPRICGRCYETGQSVRETFEARYPFSASAFTPSYRAGHCHANLAAITEGILKNLGIQDVFQSNMCTYECKNSLFSYRRSAQTGRIATLIGFQPGLST